MAHKRKEMKKQNNHKPYLTLGHYWNISEKLTIQTNLYAITRTSNTNLNWFNATTQDLIITNIYQVILLIIKAIYLEIK